MTNVEIIKKIIGEVRPIGVSSIDATRFESLKAMCDLVSQSATEITALPLPARKH